eukprot:COSAG06_NODE_36863_length_441_cov_4905.359649_2_plen_90_part_01
MQLGKIASKDKTSQAAASLVALIWPLPVVFARTLTNPVCVPVRCAHKSNDDMISFYSSMHAARMRQDVAPGRRPSPTLFTWSATDLQATH